MLSLQ
jgi:hypothetical protein